MKDDYWITPSIRTEEPPQIEAEEETEETISIKNRNLNKFNVILEDNLDQLEVSFES